MSKEKEQSKKDAREHVEHAKHYANIKISNLPHSEVEIEGEIVAEEVARCRTRAIKELGDQVSLDGFRKGHIPEAVLVGKLGERAIMEEAAEIALGHEYQHIVIDHKINVIGRPQITLTKIAKGNPLGFKIKVAIFPEFDLPDYKKIAKTEMNEKAEKLEVTDKEVDGVVDEIRRNQTEVKDKNAKAELPDFNDEFVKTLGDFKDVTDFKAKLTENILKEKESRAGEKRRIKIGEEIVKGVKVDLPEILIESELSKMTAQFNGDIERMGLKMEDYLKHIKKTEEEMKKEWRKDAEKRATLQMALNKIAVEENLLPKEDEIEGEAKHLLEHHKDAEPERVRNYVETVLANENVFRFLEGQK